MVKKQNWTAYGRGLRDADRVTGTTVLEKGWMESGRLHNRLGDQGGNEIPRRTNSDGRPGLRSNRTQSPRLRLKESISVVVEKYQAHI
jgi:hypothetical protein